MKRLALAVLLLLTCLLTGCSGLNGNTDTLMEPPNLMGEQQTVKDLLQATVGTEITLGFPAAGNYRDAITLHRLRSSADNNAIAIYKDQTQTMRIAVLERKNGSWYFVTDISTGAPAVDFVDFASGHLVVGLDMQQMEEKQLQIYSIDNGPAQMLYTCKYLTAAVTDMDGDSVSDIISIRRDGETLTASFITESDSGYSVADTCKLNSAAASVYAIMDGYTGDDERGLFIDCKTGQNHLVTQILVVRSGQLRNLLAGDSATQATRRNQTIACQKTDYDIVEIPTLSLLPGYTATSIPQYLTDWSVYRGGELVYTRSCFISQTLGFVYNVPADLRGKITFRYAYEKRRVEILDASGGPIEENEMLLAAIAVFTEDELVRSGFTRLGEMGTTVYGASTYSNNSANPLNHTLEDIRQRFSVLSW